MNDESEIERLLREMRPAALPPELRRRLDRPPAAARVAFLRRALAFGAAAAAVICLVAIPLHQRSLPQGREDAGIEATALAAVASTSQRVSTLRTVGTVEQGPGCMWRLVEVSWVEETVFLSAANPEIGSVQIEEQFKTVVPVAIPFD
ncbi:MAG: hypothetical protein R3F11_21790 [Verrucomicrobiales bacterium]